MSKLYSIFEVINEFKLQLSKRAYLILFPDFVLKLHSLPIQNVWLVLLVFNFSSYLIIEATTCLRKAALGRGGGGAITKVLTARRFLYGNVMPPIPMYSKVRLDTSPVATCRAAAPPKLTSSSPSTSDTNCLINDSRTCDWNGKVNDDTNVLDA